MSIITCIQNVGFIGLLVSVCISWDLGNSEQTVDVKKNVILKVGTRGIIPCAFTRRSYSVEWKRQGKSEPEPLVSLDTDFNIGARGGPGYDAGLFNITEDYSLVIKDVKVQDEGLYLCRVLDYETGIPILKWTQVSVQASPDEPFPIILECMMKDANPGACILEINSTSKLTCLVTRYYPHIELHFLHGSEKVVYTEYEEWNNTDGTKNKTVMILISVSDKPYQCVASGLPGIDGNRTVTVFAQANAPPNAPQQGLSIVAIVVPVLMLAGVCILIATVFILHVKGMVMTKSNPVKFKKIFMDPIHGNMEFQDELLIKIIDTPQFQRLRNIKQLGGCYYVYPGAAHNRFEHSLGVCQLAGQFIRTLGNNQPELKITDKDIRRVEIAGLCHDLGHGPLSRVFDKDFIRRRSRKNPELEGLKNVDLSVMMFDHLIQENDLKNEDLNDSDITEIKRMIQGVKDDENNVAAKKRFLYQIVTNKSTGIDVDKFDYFARDCHQLGITNSFDYKRCMKFARVIRLDNGRRILCFREKEADNLYKMFHVRCMLHRRVYQHRASTAIEHMIMDAFEKADEATDVHGEKCFKIFPAKDGSKLTMTETLIKQDMYAYTYMTDSIVDRILSTTEKGLQEARDILESVQKRDKTKLYRFVHEVLIPSQQTDAFLKKWKTSDIINGIVETNAGLKESLFVKIVKIDYGQEDKNPINKVHFYSKSDQDKAFTLKGEDISLILPKAFQEKYIRIYCKKPDDQLKSDIRTSFENWYKWAIESTKQDTLKRERGPEQGFRNLVDHTSLNSRQTEEIGMAEAAPGHDDVRMTRSKHAKFKKVFMDPIHGSMVFHDELLIKIIDTPQFQRLRRIKQLGGCYYVYPGAAHNRFEHSLGVCHLAGEFIRTLHRNQPELNITPKDIRRVEIAGLCHDLGHGPLSHVFEKDFIPRFACKHPERQELKGLKHEDLSAMMFDHLIHQNDLKSEDFNDSDITEIKRMMKGVKDDGDNVPAEKGFLYQIVTNKPTGIDVDKWDYFARDCHHLGIPNSFDHKRCMEFARVIQQSSGRQILCFRDKEADNLYQMFYVRYMLHRRVYQHKVSSIIEHMIMDAFKEAEDARDVSGAECFKIFPAKDGSKLTITETLKKKDMHAYTYMTDSIQERILSTTEKGLEKARGILENVQKRDKTNMYRVVHEVLIPSEYGEDFLKKWKEEQKIVDDIVRTSAGLEDYLIVKVVKINYGQKGKNPINNVHFYSKSDQDKAVTLTDEEISLILPKAFQEIFVRVYCKKLDAQRNADVKAAFKKWYKSEIDSLKRLKQDALKRERGQKTPERRNVGTSSTRDKEEQRPSTEPSGKSVQRNLFGDSSDNKGRGNDEQECKQTLLTDMV